MEIMGLLMNMLCMHMLNALLDKKLIRANDLYLCSVSVYLDQTMVRNGHNTVFCKAHGFIGGLRILQACW